MARSIVRERSFSFSLKIIKLYQFLKEERREYTLSKQILRSGTSVGANIREALNGESKADFIHKLAIAQKECDETLYWLELFEASELIGRNQLIDVKRDASEIFRMLASIIITTKSKLKARA